MVGQTGSGRRGAGSGGGFGDPLHGVVRHIYQGRLAGHAPDRPDDATFADGHEEMRIGDAIAISAREGRWVEVAG